MDSPQIPEWFLELTHGRVGPFTLEQLQGFLNDGEIPATARVTSARLHGVSVSVEEALRAENPENGMPELPEAPSEDMPPPIPDSVLEVKAAPSAPVGEPVVDTQPVQPPPLPAATDPSMASELFDSLQAAKERKASRVEPPPVTSPAKNQIPRIFWWMAATSLILVIALVGVVQWLAKSNSPTASKLAQKFTPPAPHVQPAQPVAKAPPRPTVTGRAITIAPPPMQKRIFTPPPRPIAPPQNPTSSLADTQRNERNDVPQADPNEDRRFDQPGYDDRNGDPQNTNPGMPPGMNPNLPPNAALNPDGTPIAPGEPGYFDPAQRPDQLPAGQPGQPGQPVE